MNQLFRRLDNARLLRCECVTRNPRWPDTSDIESHMYTPRSGVRPCASDVDANRQAELTRRMRRIMELCSGREIPKNAGSTDDNSALATLMQYLLKAHLPTHGW